MHHVEVVTQLEGAHLEQLPKLIDAATYADGHEPLGEHKFLRLQRGDDLTMAVLAYEHGRLVGYGHTLVYGTGEGRRVSCEFVVHPDERRRGVGRLLLAEALVEARKQSARRMDLWAYNDSPASEKIADQFGFEPTRRLLHLHRHISSSVPVETPAGAVLRRFRPGDEERWLALNNRIFQGHPENGAWTLEDLEARMAQPWFDPNDVLMVDVNGTLAGFCWLKVEDRGDDGRVGEIYVIGTSPSARGIGLGRHLLGAALAHLRQREVRIAAIYVDDSNTAAVSLYESAGFHHHHVDVCYSLQLPVDAERPVAEAAA